MLSHVYDVVHFSSVEVYKLLIPDSATPSSLLAPSKERGEPKEDLVKTVGGCLESLLGKVCAAQDVMAIAITRMAFGWKEYRGWGREAQVRG